MFVCVCDFNFEMPNCCIFLPFLIDFFLLSNPFRALVGANTIGLGWTEVQVASRFQCIFFFAISDLSASLCSCGGWHSSQKALLVQYVRCSDGLDEM